MRTPLDMEENTDISRFADDRFLVSRLVAGDNGAWRWLLDEVVYPLFRANIHGVRDICLRHGVTETAVASRLYQTLSRDDCKALRAFRFECQFRSWVYWFVRDAAKRAISEVAWHQQCSVVAPHDLEIRTDANCFNSDTAYCDDEFRRVLNAGLGKLWHLRPLGAIALVLRGELELPSKAVAKFVGKTPSAVDQIYHRAQQALRDILGRDFTCTPFFSRREDAFGMSAELGRLAFSSSATPSAEAGWLAEIILPADYVKDAGSSNAFDVSLICPAGGNGLLRLCGAEAKLKHGAGRICWPEFIRTARQREISMTIDGNSISGQPVFSSLIEMT